MSGGGGAALLGSGIGSQQLHPPLDIEYDRDVQIPRVAVATLISNCTTYDPFLSVEMSTLRARGVAAFPFAERSSTETTTGDVYSAHSHYCSRKVSARHRAKNVYLTALTESGDHCTVLAKRDVGGRVRESRGNIIQLGRGMSGEARRDAGGRL